MLVGPPSETAWPVFEIQCGLQWEDGNFGGAAWAVIGTFHFQMVKWVPGRLSLPSQNLKVEMTLPTLLSDQKTLALILSVLGPEKLTHRSVE